MIVGVSSSGSFMIPTTPGPPPAGYTWYRLDAAGVWTPLGSSLATIVDTGVFDCYLAYSPSAGVPHGGGQTGGPPAVGGSVTIEHCDAGGNVVSIGPAALCNVDPTSAVPGSTPCVVRRSPGGNWYAFSWPYQATGPGSARNTADLIWPGLAGF